MSVAVFRRRAVYEVARKLGANVVALGHTADDFCESFLRNAMFTGRISAFPAITWSSKREFRLIRPLVYVSENLTRAFVEVSGRAGHSMRLLPKNRHCAAYPARLFRAKSKKIIPF